MMPAVFEDTVDAVMRKPARCGERGKCARVLVVSIQPAAVGADPERPIVSGIENADFIRADAGRIAPIVEVSYKCLCVPVEPVEAALCADPNVAFAVFAYRIDGVARYAPLIGRIVAIHL